jgi:CheY-like chemotaxis protein
MSHELRTPLNSVIGFSQILKMHELGERPLECTEHILKAGIHLLGLIDEVLDIARIEAGKLPISSEPVLVSDAVHEAVEMVRPLADARGIRIGLDCVASCRQHVRADRQRLKQVLLNILSNAVKYNSENGRVYVTCKNSQAGMLRLNVVDTGNGVSEADQSRLFIPFQRLSAAETEVQGTGLGLALSKRLVEVMGGSIGVMSAPGHGSTFWIEFEKVGDPESAVNVESIASASQLTRIEGRRTVLYIEDNLANLRLMEHIVSYRPYIRLIPAMQGRLGLDLARQHAPDLILSDLHLADISGREVLAALQSDPLTSGIPLIVISADATPGQVSRLLSAGAAGYLTKPLNVEALLKTLDAHLAGQKTARPPLHESEPATC